MIATLWRLNSPVWLLIAAWVIAYTSLVRGARLVHWAFVVTGAAFLFLAWASPIGVLAEGYLFSAHMVQHLVILLVAPACLMLSIPAEQAESCFARKGWDRVGRLLSTSALGWTLGVGAMWVWHIPWLCSTAAVDPRWGLFRDATLAASGIAFWWPIYSPCVRFRLHPLSGCLYLFSACLGCTILGIYITFVPLSVCPVFANPIDRVGILNGLYDAGLTPGVDQRLGGLIMWVPPCLLYTSAIISLLSRWYAAAEPMPLTIIAAQRKEA